MMRNPPNIEGTPLPSEWRPLDSYFDSIQEAFAYSPHDVVADELEDARQKAAEADASGKGLWGVHWGAEYLQVAATGARGGFKWVIGNDDFLILVKTRASEWGVAVRYLSAGLWEHGYPALRERVDAILESHFERRLERAVSLSRIDVAVDFYLPGFAESTTPRLAEAALLPSRCKVKTESADGRLQTLTFGAKQSVEIQLYDKTREIHEASGKEWFYAIWQRAGLPADVRRDVWRVEVRFSGDWLKDRDIRTFEDYMATGGQLVAEALLSRRLCVPSSTDSNRGRWALHPLWTAAWEIAAHRWREYVPIGRHTTGRRDYLIKQLMKQGAGLIRAAHVLANPETEDLLDDYLIQRIAWDAMALAADDEKNPQKIEQLKERYRYVEEAR
ncbi:hypothetical protein [Ferrovibrio sp.]|uniref:hypothetical protein n=1 Tax=Ferrovibrio sp. TaxID=1917215 RepID=UPI0025C6C392|nr:hypothetical protein [Ferrovibrio sp.]MBX3456587.1 hypothetical protein [Ferrovibrio sp.]